MKGKKIMRKTALFKKPNAEMLEMFNGKIRRVEKFDTVLELFENYYCQSELDKIGKHFKVYLGESGYEPLALFVINDEIVITVDSFNGDVIGAQTLASFLHYALKDYFDYGEEMYGEDF